MTDMKKLREELLEDHDEAARSDAGFRRSLIQDLIGRMTDEEVREAHLSAFEYLTEE